MIVKTIKYRAKTRNHNRYGHNYYTENNLGKDRFDYISHKQQVYKQTMKSYQPIHYDDYSGDSKNNCMD